MNLKPLLNAILQQYELPVDGYHGVDHWARVLENGLCLCSETGADREVIAQGGVLHGSRRVNEGHASDPGLRAAGSAKTRQEKHCKWADREGELTLRAFERNTHARTLPAVTIQTCWDVDRL